MDYQEAIEEVKKNFMRVYLMFTGIGSFYFSVLFYLIDMPIVSVFCAIWCAVVVVAFLLLSKLTFQFDQVFNLGITIMAVIVFGGIIILEKHFFSIYLWLFIFPLVAFIGNGFRNAVYWSVAVVVMAVVGPLIAQYLNVGSQVILTAQHKAWVDYSTMFQCFFLLLLCLYAYGKMNHITVKGIHLLHEMDKKESIKMTLEERKFTEVYDQIEEYIKKKKPYQQANYNINMLANDLNSNATYMAKGIKQGSGLSFNHYINKCRVEAIIEKIKIGEHEQYTLKHLYTQEGFTNQTTFNRVFKDVTGETPSKFIESL